MNIIKIKIEKSLPHIAGLLLFLILPIFVFDRENERAIFWMYSYYFQLIFMTVAFYVNYLVIVPRFFFSKKKIYFWGSMLLFVIVLLATSQYFYNVLAFDSLRPDAPPGDGMIPQRNALGLHPKLVDNFFLMVVVLGFSSGMAIIQELRKNETKQKEIERVKVDTELAFLKNQISPHFFFNALNNIYALIAIDSSKAQDSVEKLSGLMRYLIYDSDIKVVDIKKEFDFVHNYIELMKQRLTSKVNLQVNIDRQLPDRHIPPLLFIPFIENAFKHGISYREESFITISFKVTNDSIIFECKNSIPESNRATENEEGGIGIVNIKKRLELIYGDRAQLEIQDKNKQYAVLLSIPLQQ